MHSLKNLKQQIKMLEEEIDLETAMLDYYLYFLGRSELIIPSTLFGLLLLYGIKKKIRFHRFFSETFKMLFVTWWKIISVYFL